MRANRVMRVAAVAAIGMLAGTRAQAAGTVNPEPVVRRIVVSVPDRKLAVVENDEVVQVFDVAVGAPVSPSPTGNFTIINRVADPTYYHSGTVIAPGPRNPIGTRWIGLSQKGYGIHGTDEPWSIGYARSHGCIRLRNADVERLFERVRPGDLVELHAERTTETDQFFATVH
jgi:lipoprotein-anchoring transpeptidase ErfK/SrfK